MLLNAAFNLNKFRLTNNIQLETEEEMGWRAKAELDELIRQGKWN